jgi:hypothetical protein
MRTTHMRRPFSLLLLTLCVGCQNTVGPVQRSCDPKPVALPCAPTAIQERNLRDRLGLPDPSPSVGPQTDTAPPGVYRNP